MTGIPANLDAIIGCRGLSLAMNRFNISLRNYGFRTDRVFVSNQCMACTKVQNLLSVDDVRQFWKGSKCHHQEAGLLKSGERKSAPTNVAGHGNTFFHGFCVSKAYIYLFSIA